MFPLPTRERVRERVRRSFDVSTLGGQTDGASKIASASLTRWLRNDKIRETYPMPSQADVVATVLAEAGVDRIFGVPGSLSSVELIDAAARAGVSYVLCSNESSAAAMAGVYGAMKETVGVVSTGVGPGAAAVVHGVAHLHMERSPVLVLTDRYGEQEYRRLPRQRLEQHELFR